MSLTASEPFRIELMIGPVAVMMQSNVAKSKVPSGIKRNQIRVTSIDLSMDCATVRQVLPGGGKPVDIVKLKIFTSCYGGAQKNTVVYR